MKANLLSVLAVLLLAPLAPSPAAEAAPPVRKPNLIFILADDLGYGDVRCLNPQRGKIPTPNLDRLAAQGMTFTDMHSGASVCTPTRYGVLTGRYAWRSRLQRGVLDGYVPPLIAADRLTLPELLKQQGYHTACLGKWHLGFTIEGAGKNGGKQKAVQAGAGKFAGAPLASRTADGPTTRGFDYFYGFHHARMMESVFENDRVVEMVKPVDMLPKLARRAAESITKQSKTGQPFFLCLTDFMATAADLLGATLPATAAEDSFSFLPELLGTGHTKREAIVHHSIQGRFSIRQGPWKLELCPGSGGWAAPRDADARKRKLPELQLYNLADDIGEKQNLQSARPDVVQRLTALLEKTVTNGRSTPGPAQHNDGPVDIHKTNAQALTSEAP